MPAPEQVAPEPASRSRLQQAAAWSVAALITVAAAISVLLSRTVAGATASAMPARATAKPSQHHPGPQPRRARARAHAHRVMTTHAVEVAARARRTGEGSPSARHSWGKLLVVRRLLRGEYVAAARRDSQLQRAGSSPSASLRTSPQTATATRVRLRAP